MADDTAIESSWVRFETRLVERLERMETKIINAFRESSLRLENSDLPRCGANQSSTGAQITLEEYLATDYTPDREWIDGELRERNVGTWEHARLQALLAAWLCQHEDEWGVVGTIGQRIRVSSNRVRIPDLALLNKGKQPPIVTEPPVLVVEILSPDDSYSDTQERVHDYRSMGIKVVWLIDPRTRTGRMSIGGASPISEDAWLLAKVLKVPGTAIYVDLDQLFANAGLRYTLPELVARSDYSQPQPPEEREWIDAPAVGRELL